MRINLTPTLAAGAMTLAALTASANGQETVKNPESVKALIERTFGTGMSGKIETELAPELSTSGAETFVISSVGDKPLVQGSTLSALTTGLNWFLNHTAHENVGWNRPSASLTSLPLPSATETHTSAADYRYYLNYCTFSYSMSTWTWERWEREIDYMALHGINMPLQIVGLDVVWRRLLTEDFGYSKDEADEFIAGPCFQAWWGMNNLEGWGGKNPDWWYDRQEQLAKKILSRMRELGIEPVLPGFCGMVPHNFTAKTGMSAIAQGNWCGFTRPYILNPETDAFKTVADKYYARLEELMGKSQFYSMDPFHEGANTSGISNIGNAYKKIYEAMDRANAGSQWVIQQWQWSSSQYSVLDNVPKGRLIVLDLFSDGKPGQLGAYKGHDVVYCALPNFGGRTGFFGRFNGIANGYFDKKADIPAITGIGATPEAIEQTPVIYDLLFELPWHSTKPDPQKWMAEYARSRYGVANENAATAWELLRNSALNCTTSLQGPHEAVMCARPAWTVNSVSTWGGSEIFYDPNQVAKAAYALLDANLSGENYSYDLVDICRQALTDYSYYLLQAINQARTTGATEFAGRKETFLQLMTDLNDLLATNPGFMVGTWTQMARDIADEVEGTTEADKKWLELNNARTLITTWGARQNSENGGLRDYSYRQWNGILKDYYRERWARFFAGQNIDWYSFDHAWAVNQSLSYPNTAQGDTRTIALRLLEYYLPRFGDSFIYRSMANDLTAEAPLVAYRGEAIGFPVTNGCTISWDKVTLEASKAIPADAPMGDYTATARFGDTEVKFRISVRDRITAPRTVTAVSADPAMGSVEITGENSLSVTTDAQAVAIKAIPADGCSFSRWTIDGIQVSTDETYNYYGAKSATVTAHFTEAKVIADGNWKLAYSTTDADGIVITGIEAGSGPLNLDAHNVVAIEPGVFTRCQELTSLSIPASLVSLNGLSLHKSVTGSSQENLAIALPSPLSPGSSWRIVMKVNNNGTTYNQWGSGLLATGTNALANSYNGGFQLYLNAAGRLVVKTNSAENTSLGNLVGTDFTVVADYSAIDKKFSVTLVNATGQRQTATVSNYTMADIAGFSTSIPAGVNIESLCVMPLEEGYSTAFHGCLGLEKFVVESGNAIFSTDSDALMNADGTRLVSLPEGRLASQPFRLLSDGKALHATPLADAQGEIIDNNRQVSSIAPSDNQISSLWSLTTGDEHFKVKHLNSARFFGGKAGNHNRIELPVSATQWHGEYDYEITAEGTKPLISFHLPSANLYATASGTLEATPTRFEMELNPSVQFNEQVNIVALPFGYSAPKSAYVVTGIDGDMLLTAEVAEGTTVNPGTALIVVGKTAITPSDCSNPTLDNPGYLTATLLGRTGMTAGTFFVYSPSTKRFELSNSTTVAPNNGFISNSAFGNPIAAKSLKIDILENSAIENPETPESDAVKFYNINGLPADKGLVVGTDGSKKIL